MRKERIKLGLRDLRRKRGMTMMELAKKSGISYMTIYAIETRSSNIKADTAVRLCEALGCSMDELFCFER